MVELCLNLRHLDNLENLDPRIPNCEQGFVENLKSSTLIWASDEVLFKP